MLKQIVVVSYDWVKTKILCFQFIGNFETFIKQKQIIEKNKLEMIENIQCKWQNKMLLYKEFLEIKKKTQSSCVTKWAKKWLHSSGNNTYKEPINII